LSNWIWIAVIVLAVFLLLGIFASGRRRAMAGGETVVSGGSTGAGFVLGILFAIVLLVILYFGIFQWNWFGTQNVGPAQSSPAVTSPVSSPSLSGSPPASASP
jgi:uncharacterized membrane protein